MGLWKFWCVSCERDIEEEFAGHGGKAPKALCKPCARRICEEYGLGKIAEGIRRMALYCYWHEVNGWDLRKPAARSYGTWGLCEECYISLDKPKVGSPKPEKPNVGRDFVGPALAVRVIGGEEAAEQVSRAKRTEEKKEESAMATEKPTVNWLEIQEVRNSGKFTIKQIAKNFGVEEWQVYQKTKSPNRSIAKDLANLPSNNGHATDALPYIAATPTVTAKNGDGKSRKQITLEELREMRDSLNHAISMVERGTASGV